MDRPTKRLKMSSPPATPTDDLAPRETVPEGDSSTALVTHQLNHSTQAVGSHSDHDSTYDQGTLLNPALPMPNHLFQNASNFVISNSTFITGNPQSGGQTSSSREHDGAVTESTAIRLLLGKAILEAALDSSARYPPPRCHESTRVEIRDRILAWLNDPDHTSQLLWLQGPVGVGKSALAQTITEFCRDQGWIIAAFFFSRPNKRDDPNRLIPSLAYQLAVNFLTYKHLLDRLLADDPSILEKALPIQFQRLILEPLLHCFHDVSERVLLVLDGLDECKGDSAQREIIALVVAFSRTCVEKKIPVFFMIFSRPEWQIVSAFSKEDPLKLSQREELKIDDEQSLLDFDLFLRDRFKGIRAKYEEIFTPEMDPWPMEEQLQVLNEKGRGLFAFGETALRFIEDDDIGDPVTQLNICLDFLKGNQVPVGVDPFDTLASLYLGILRNVHQRMLHPCLHLLFPRTSSPAVHLDFNKFNEPDFIATLMGWSPTLHLSCIQRLKSVVYVHKGTLEFYHASFNEFLINILYTEEFGLTSQDIMDNFKERSLRWYRIWKRDGDDPSEESIEELKNIRTSHSVVDVYRKILTNTFKILQWVLHLRYLHMPNAFEKLNEVNFADLFYWGAISTWIFRLFLHDLVTRRMNVYEPSPNLLRREAHSQTDTDLFVKYSPLLNWHHGIKKFDMDMDELDVAPKEEWEFMFLTLPGLATNTVYSSRQDSGPTPTTGYYHGSVAVAAVAGYSNFLFVLLEPRPMYFFLGHGSSTSLVLTWREEWRLTSQEYTANCFRQIRDYHSLPDSWPSEEQINDLVGLFGEACSGNRNKIELSAPRSMRTIILRFIGDTRFADPVQRLEEILQLITHRNQPCNDREYSEAQTSTIASNDWGHNHTMDPANPVLMDQLLDKILSTIPTHHLTNARRLILFLECASALPRDARVGFWSTLEALSNFLGIQKEAISQALGFLTPIIFQCPLLWESQLVENLFLLRLPEANSQAWHLRNDHDPFMGPVLYSNIWVAALAQCVKWCNSFLSDLQSFRILLNGKADDEHEPLLADWEIYQDRLAAEYTQKLPRHESDLTNLIFLNSCWVIFGRLGRAEPDSLANHLRGLRICNLELSSNFEPFWILEQQQVLYGNWSPFLWCMNEFYYHTREFRKGTALPHLVRVDCQSLADRCLFAKLDKLQLRYSKATFPLRCRSLYWSHGITFPAWVTMTLHDTSPMGQGAVRWEDASKYNWQVFLLGYGANSCLVLVRESDVRPGDGNGHGWDMLS